MFDVAWFASLHPTVVRVSHLRGDNGNASVDTSERIFARSCNDYHLWRHCFYHNTPSTALKTVPLIYRYCTESASGDDYPKVSTSKDQEHELEQSGIAFTEEDVRLIELFIGKALRDDTRSAERPRSLPS